MTYDFKAYHLRSIHAASDAERAVINQELKDLYNSLPEAEKAEFNEQLQTFLVRETARLKSDYESVKGSVGDN